MRSRLRAHASEAAHESASARRATVADRNRNANSPRASPNNPNRSRVLRQRCINHARYSPSAAQAVRLIRSSSPGFRGGRVAEAARKRAKPKLQERRMALSAAARVAAPVSRSPTFRKSGDRCTTAILKRQVWLKPPLFSRREILIPCRVYFLEASE